MEPVMAAHAASVPRNASATTLQQDTNLENRFMALTSPKKDLQQDPKPNDDKRNLIDGKNEVTDEPLWCQESRAPPPAGLTR
jgi:hypothetical protein